VKQNTPLVSVCLPLFNGEKYLQEALDSLGSQTYTHLELIVSDDASKDNSLTLIENFQKEWKYSVSIHHHTPSTIGANWNNCLRHANGKYIKFLFQDDVLYPECIEKLVKEAEQDEKIGIVFCKRDFILEENSPETREWVNRFKDLQEADGFFKNFRRIRGSVILGSENLLETPMNKIGEPTTVLFPKKVLNETGYFNEVLMQILDYEFYYRILKKYDVVMVDEPLAGFRVHPGQATMVNKDKDTEDYNIYFRLLYQNFFRQLHYKVKWRLFKRFHPLVRQTVRLKKRVLHTS
jgi:glycosyltransferase involved in cell wall biosynthesis